MPTNPTPVLVFGQSKVDTSDIGRLLRYGKTSADVGEDVLLLGRTAEIAVAGIGGKASYDRLFVSVTFTHPFSLRLTPITDGKTIAGEYADLAVTQADFDDASNELVEGERATYLFEVSLSEPYVRDSVERSRHALMGAYFQVQVEQLSPMPTGGELIIGGIELMYETLVQSQVA